MPPSLLKNSVSVNGTALEGTRPGYSYSNSGGRSDDGKTPTKTLSVQEQNLNAVIGDGGHSGFANQQQQEQMAQQQEEKTKQTQFQHSGGSGRNHSVSLNESISIQDSSNPNKIKKVERRTEQIKQYLNEQQSERQAKLDEIKIKQQELAKAKEFASSEQGQVNQQRDYNKMSRGQKRRFGISNTSGQRAITDKEKEITQLQKEIKVNDNTISYFQTEQTNLKKEISAGNSGSFSTGDDSRKTKTKIPKNLPVTHSLAGVGVVQQNISRIKNFFGIDKPKSEKGTVKSVELKESISMGDSPKQNSGKDTENFYPTHIEKGTIRFDNSKFGNDNNYYSTSNYDDDRINKTVLPSGEVIEIKSSQPKQNSALDNKERHSAGAMAVPENLFTLGKEGVEHASDEFSSGKFNTNEPSELKKDIILTPIHAITQEIVPSSEKIARGDLSGISNYVTKTGKHLNDFGTDVKKDPYYYYGNANANAMLIAGTFGVGEIIPIARAGASGYYRKHVVQPKAQSIIEFAHRPQNVITEKFKITGKTAKSETGFEISEYKLTKEKVPETEIIAEVKPKRTNDPNFDGKQFVDEVVPTDKTRKQKVSPIETFEQVSDTNGYATYRATFKDQTGRFKTVDAIMTPNPVLKYTGNPKNVIALKSQPAKSNVVSRLTQEGGMELKSNIEKAPSFSKEFYKEQVRKGNVEFIEKQPTPQQNKLASLENPIDGLGNEIPFTKGEIGKVRDVAPETSKALGSKGIDVYTSELFYFDKIAERISANPQYGNQRRPQQEQDDFGMGGMNMGNVFGNKPPQKIASNVKQYSHRGKQMVEDPENPNHLIKLSTYKNRYGNTTQPKKQTRNGVGNNLNELRGNIESARTITGKAVSFVKDKTADRKYQPDSKKMKVERDVVPVQYSVDVTFDDGSQTSIITPSLAEAKSRQSSMRSDPTVRSAEINYQ